MLSYATSEHKLTPEKLGTLIDTAKATAVASAPKAVITVPDMIDVFNEIEDILRTSVTQTTIAELDADKKLRDWVECGIDRHEGHTTCLFCQSPINPARLKELNAYFSKTYKDLSQRIDAAIASVKAKSLTSSIPNTSQLYPDLQAGFDALRNEVESLNESFDAVKLSLINLLTDKKNAWQKTSHSVLQIIRCQMQQSCLRNLMHKSKRITKEPLIIQLNSDKRLRRSSATMSIKRRRITTTKSRNRYKIISRYC